MTGDKPDVVSRRSSELEKLLEPLRPKPSTALNLGLMIEQLEYLRFRSCQLQGKDYTKQQRDEENLTTLFFPGSGEGASVRYRKSVQFNAHLINAQLILAIIGVAGIMVGLICRLPI